MCNHKRTIFNLNFIMSRVQQLLYSKKRKSNLIMQTKPDLCKTVWDPLRIFDSYAPYKYAVIILNSPLNWKDDVLLHIWRKSQINITVDGGTYRWLHYLKSQGIDLLSGQYSEYVPNLITGDMDSCPPTILEKLKSMGSIVVETPDQDQTDYTKALLQLEQYIRKYNIKLNGIYVFVESSGRFDHIMANINTLYKSDKLTKTVQIMHIASSSLTWLLRPGLHSIMIPKILIQNNSWCGLLPVGVPVNCIVTTGLKWNLDKAALQFGGLVSSSNTYDNCSEVTVNTDSPVVWSMGIEPFQKSVNNYEIPKNFYC